MYSDSLILMEENTKKKSHFATSLETTWICIFFNQNMSFLCYQDIYLNNICNFYAYFSCPKKLTRKKRTLFFQRKNIFEFSRQKYLFCKLWIFFRVLVKLDQKLYGNKVTCKDLPVMSEAMIKGKIMSLRRRIKSSPG